jgi:hypothetical protein
MRCGSKTFPTPVGPMPVGRVERTALWMKAHPGGEGKRGPNVPAVPTVKRMRATPRDPNRAKFNLQALAGIPEWEGLRRLRTTARSHLSHPNQPGCAGAGLDGRWVVGSVRLRGLLEQGADEAHRRFRATAATAPAGSGGRGTGGIPPL